MRLVLRAIVVAWVAALAAAAHAGPVDANLATQAELEMVKGIGPTISVQILEERRKGAFKDWQDLIARVKGVGAGSAARFSASGLTVNGASYAAAK